MEYYPLGDIKDEEIYSSKQYVLKHKKILKREKEIEFSFPENYTKENLFANGYGSKIYENTEFIRGEIVMNILELKEAITYRYNRRENHYQGSTIERSGEEVADEIENCEYLIPLLLPTKIYPWTMISNYLIPMSILIKKIRAKELIMDKMLKLMVPNNTKQNLHGVTKKLSKYIPVELIEYEKTYSVKQVITFSCDGFVSCKDYSNLLDLLSE
jgi:hypothetical protein